MNQLIVTVTIIEIYKIILTVIVIEKYISVIDKI